MEWSEPAVILGARAHGETSLILEVMTRDHGRHLGLVRGGRSKTKAAALQPGNLVTARWFARLDQHLGQFTIDPLQLRAGRLMMSSAGLYGLNTVASLLRLLPERDPHAELFDALEVVVEHLCGDQHADHAELNAVIAGALVVRFELAMLEALGFGLDLTRCAATGTTQDLVYVSPKSARAVCREAGTPYHAKLLPLPGFLMPTRAGDPSCHDVVSGFELTRYFLERNVYGPRGMKPDPARASLVRLLERALDD